MNTCPKCGRKLGNCTCKVNYTAVKDSGKRQEFNTGSVRDTQDGKPRYDLIPMYALERLAMHYTNGAAKYGDRNWEKGQPLSRYFGSAFRHLVAAFCGKTDEDHLAAVAWNVFAIIAQLQWIQEGKLSGELNDMNWGTPESTKKYVTGWYTGKIVELQPDGTGIVVHSGVCVMYKDGESVPKNELAYGCYVPCDREGNLL